MYFVGIINQCVHVQPMIIRIKPFNLTFSGDDNTGVKTIYLICCVDVHFHDCLIYAERIRATYMTTADNSRHFNCHYNTLVRLTYILWSWFCTDMLTIEHVCDGKGSRQKDHC